MTAPAAVGIDPGTRKRRKMGVSPTRRTLAWLRSHGYFPGVVEQTLPGTWIKRDLFGCFDIVAVKPGFPILAVQTTSTRTAERTVKIEESAAARDWLAAGGAIEVHGWVKRVKGGAFHYGLRRLVAHFDGTAFCWTEEA